MVCGDLSSYQYRQSWIEDETASGDSQKLVYTITRKKGSLTYQCINTDEYRQVAETCRIKYRRAGGEG